MKKNNVRCVYSPGELAEMKLCSNLSQLFDDHILIKRVRLSGFQRGCNANAMILTL